MPMMNICFLLIVFRVTVVQSKYDDNLATSAPSSIAPTDGCTLIGNTKTDFITARKGSSVLLSCSCTEIHPNPATFKWKKSNPSKTTWDMISSESERYRNRIQLFNSHCPGNLSLLISHLTEEDEGYYMCFLEPNQYRYMQLTVKAVPGKGMVYFPIAIFAAIIFHIVIIVHVTKKDKNPTRAHCGCTDGDETV